MGTVPELNEVVGQALDSVIDSEVKATLGDQTDTESSLTSGDKKNNNVESTTTTTNRYSETLFIIATSSSSRLVFLISFDDVIEG